MDDRVRRVYLTWWRRAGSSVREGRIDMSAKTSTATQSRRTTKARTDWERLRKMTEEEIEAAASSDPDNPPTDAEFWRDARTVCPGSPRLEPFEQIEVDVQRYGLPARRFVRTRRRIAKRNSVTARN